MSKQVVGSTGAFLASGAGAFVIAILIWVTGEHPCGATEYIGRGSDGMCTGRTSNLPLYIAGAAALSTVVGFVAGWALQLFAEFFMKDDQR